MGMDCCFVVLGDLRHSMALPTLPWRAAPCGEAVVLSVVLGLVAWVGGGNCTKLPLSTSEALLQSKSPCGGYDRDCY